MKYVVAGGGIAALSALRAIRARDPAGQLTVVSDEDPAFYFRPMTPLVVEGRKEAGDLVPAEGPPPGVRVVRGRAAALDGLGPRLRLEDGRELPFDRLLIATGGVPRVPDVPGLDRGGVHCLRTLRDATALREAAGRATAAVVIGGGFVGVKAAVALAHRGLRVTVVEKEPQILLPRLDAVAAGIVADTLAARGIALLTQETVAEVHPGARGVRLASGGSLACDLVCVATGVSPAVGWLAGSGVALERGVIVDQLLQSSRDGVYAAGDVAQYADPASGRSVVSALWTNAVRMGKVAGTNMAGGRTAHALGPEVYNATEIEGLPLVSVGDVLGEGGAGREVSRWRRGGAYRKLVLDGDVLSGAIFLGELRNAGVYASLITARRPLGALRDKVLEGALTHADVAAAGASI